MLTTHEIKKFWEESDGYVSFGRMCFKAGRLAQLRAGNHELNAVSGVIENLEGEQGDADKTV
jgi:hypothetical protein